MMKVMCLINSIFIHKAIISRIHFLHLFNIINCYKFIIIIINLSQHLTSEKL